MTEKLIKLIKITVIVALLWVGEAVINYREPYPIITYNLHSPSCK